jgi:hypothetical protein
MFIPMINAFFREVDILWIRANLYCIPLTLDLIASGEFSICKNELDRLDLSLLDNIKYFFNCKLFYLKKIMFVFLSFHMFLLRSLFSLLNNAAHVPLTNVLYYENLQYIVINIDFRPD